MANRKWLVTGGCGFIGRALISNLLEDKNNLVRVLDDLSVGSEEDLNAVSSFRKLELSATHGWQDSLELLEGSILDPNVVDVACREADIVVHLAANTGVAPSVADPLRDCDTNVFGTLNLLEACRRNGIERFIFASSGAPLGEQTPPLSETLAPRPASPYGASKLAGEGYCSAYFHSFGINTVALRFGNVYGPGSGKKSSVVAKFIQQALRGEVLEIYGDGTQTRDFIYVGDLVDAIRKAASASEAGGEVFQIATARETTVAEITEHLLRIMSEEGIRIPKVDYGPERIGDVKRNFSDTTKAQNILSWKATVDIEQGLRTTVKYFLDVYI